MACPHQQFGNRRREVSDPSLTGGGRRFQASPLMNEAPLAEAKITSDPEATSLRQHTISHRWCLQEPHTGSGPWLSLVLGLLGLCTSFAACQESSKYSHRGKCCIIEGGGCCCCCLPEPTWDQQCLHLPSPPTPKHPNNLPYIAQPLRPGLRDVLLALKEVLSRSGPSSLKQALLEGEECKGTLRAVADGRATADGGRG